LRFTEITTSDRSKCSQKKAAANAAALHSIVANEKRESFCRKLEHGGRAVLITGL
jgi:hypothetical protein